MANEPTCVHVFGAADSLYCGKDHIGTFTEGDFTKPRGAASARSGRVRRRVRDRMRVTQ